MKNKKFQKKNILLGASIILIISLLVGIFNQPRDHEMTMDQRRESFISQKEAMQHDLMGEGMYSCCLEKACTYCIEKTPGHGKGAACNCLKDVMEGVHPCGECIGEILEGHGNPFLAEYFATAIAEKTGHVDAIKQIISEKYDIPVEEQA